MQFKGFKKRLDPFQKVDFEPKSATSAVLVLLCAGVFGTAFFVGGQIMSGYNEKVAQIFHGESVLAAENQKNEKMAVTQENIVPLPEGKKVSEAMSGAASSVKDQAGRVARARKIARQLAAEKALRRSGRVLSGSTKKLPGGLRVCTGNSDHPERGGATHMDEDCCADYNETPNPRCYYSPEKMGILKGR